VLSTPVSNKDAEQRLDAIFGALSDRTRRELLRRLAGGSATVSELARPFQMSLPAVSKHLRVLERAGLVRRQVEGRSHHCWLMSEPLADAESWIAHYRRFWEETLDSFSDHLSRHAD
jgi:DNA-binding transcriptional ArsR family regulator